MDFEEILTVTRASGGATIDTFTGEPVSQDTGYVVALPGAELILTKNDNWLSGLKRYATRLRRGEYLGTWIYGGELYLDSSIIVEDRKIAQRLAKRYDQLAFFDLSTKQAINTI